MYMLTHIYTSIHQIKQYVLLTYGDFLVKNAWMLRSRDLDFDLELKFYIQLKRPKNVVLYY